MSRARRWDAVATAEAPGLAGDEAEFVVLPDGTLVGEQAQVPLADALALEPPYRAEAVRREGDLWAAAARRIDVARFAHDGDEIELSVVDGERTLTVDGLREWGSIPELERPLASYAVHARRLDGDLWEVRVSPL